MEDTFQFIIESPQHNTGHKKRPRLVTSCDNCRLKKIKCLQPSPESKCEACKAAKIPCRFKDRERYFAERSRAIAGPSVSTSYSSDPRQDHNPSLDAFSVASSSSSPSLTNSNPRSNSHSPKASGLVSADSESNGRYSYSDPRRGDPNYRHSANSSISSFHSRSNSSYGYNNYVGSPSPVLQHPHNPRLPPHQPDYRHIQLFDPERSQFPHPTLMPHFIQLFFEHLGSEFTFLTYEQVINDFWETRLSPVVANCVAAMASRFSNIPELAVRGLHNVAEAYTDIAKNLVASLLHLPSMDTLHAIMLLSWAEYKNSRISVFRQYCQKAITMAQELGLSDSDRMMHANDSEQRRRQATWAGIVQLHLTASQTVTSNRP